MILGVAEWLSIRLISHGDLAYHLEEVDAELLEDELLSRRSMSLPRLFALCAFPLLLSSLYSLFFLLPLVLFSLSILCSLLLFRFFLFTARRFDSSLHTLLASLRTRQSASFSLRLDGSRSCESLRSSLLSDLRLLAAATHSFSSIICTQQGSKSSPDLLMTYCTKEMRELLEGEVLPAFFTLPSLQTLSELLLLLRSEALRRCLLGLPFCPLTVHGGLLRLSLKQLRLSSSLTSHSTRLRQFSTHSAVRPTSPPLEGESTLKVQLQVILQGLESGCLTNEAALAVLSTLVRTQINLPAIPVQVASAAADEMKEEELDFLPTPTLCNTSPKPTYQVFETVGERDERKPTAFCKEESALEGESGHSEMMSELRAALLEKAEQHRRREQAILREQRETEGGEEERAEEEGSETESNDPPAWWKPTEEERLESCPPSLHSELFAAIRRRGGRSSDAVIGDSGSDSDMD